MSKNRSILQFCQSEHQMVANFGRESGLFKHHFIFRMVITHPEGFGKGQASFIGMSDDKEDLWDIAITAFLLCCMEERCKDPFTTVSGMDHAATFGLSGIKAKESEIANKHAVLVIQEVVYLI